MVVYAMMIAMAWCQESAFVDSHDFHNPDNHDPAIAAEMESEMLLYDEWTLYFVAITFAAAVALLVWTT